MDLCPGRSVVARTPGPLHPMQVLYQTELHLDKWGLSPLRVVAVIQGAVAILE